MEPAFNGDGYPNEETLQRIETWPWRDVAGCLDYARAAWHWPDWVGEELSDAERELVHAAPGDRFVRFATGGWSGNEDVVHALGRNVMVRARCWCLSASGGLHIYRYPRAERQS